MFGIDAIGSKHNTFSSNVMGFLSSHREQLVKCKDINNEAGRLRCTKNIISSIISELESAEIKYKTNLFHPIKAMWKERLHRTNERLKNIKESNIMDNLYTQFLEGNGSFTVDTDNKYGVYLPESKQEKVFTREDQQQLKNIVKKIITHENLECLYAKEKELVDNLMEAITEKGTSGLDPMLEGCLTYLIANVKKSN